MPRVRCRALAEQTLRLLGVFRAFRTVERTALTTLVDALSVEGATDDVVTHTGKVFDTTAANQHDAVLLEVVTLTRDVTDDLKP
jgi:hypothetical protein